MSLESSFPRIAELERDYGSLIRAMIALQKERKRQARREGVSGAKTKTSAGPAGPGGVLTSFVNGAGEMVERLTRELGDRVILTSGVRSVVKQSLLFLNKAYNSQGNLSLASRQLAPPGYSFHGIGDFDVGQVGFGPANFTERFICTEVYRRLESLGYLTLRYPRDNCLGVRFEPWHIKVVQKV